MPYHGRVICKPGGPRGGCRRPRSRCDQEVREGDTIRPVPDDFRPSQTTFRPFPHALQSADGDTAVVWHEPGSGARTGATACLPDTRNRRRLRRFAQSYARGPITRGLQA